VILEDDDDKPDIRLGEEGGTIEFEDLDKKEEEEEVLPEPPAEVDPLAEIEGKAGAAETLVLKL
jgi:hypothetical protein